ncbi:MAG: hypothetical protein WCE38_24055, partial [Burkholderiales bacterium]
MSANRERLPDRSNAPAAPIGVRTRAVIAGHWALLGVFFAVAVAVVVFVLLPGWLSPGRAPVLPHTEPVHTPASGKSPAARKVPDSPQAATSPAMPPPVHEQAPARPPDLADAPQPDHAVTPAEGPAKGPTREAPPSA